MGHDRLGLDSLGSKGLGPQCVRDADQLAIEPSSLHAADVFRGGLLGLIAALVPVVALWGYTVDDALVTARMAHHLAIGVGYRFNADGPVVDAVTPLGYAHLLAPFARHGCLDAWQAARWIGVATWLGAASWLGLEVARAGCARWRWAALVPLASCAPIAAWVGSGMETGIVTALATVALGRSLWWLSAAGLAAAWRPELFPWAVVLAVGKVVVAGEWPRGLLQALSLAAVPLVLVTLVRFVCFGSPTPLAVLAKPSDLQHGVLYAAGALLWTGLPVLAIAPHALRRAPRAMVLVVAFVAHLFALVAAGGDWMALFRLVVPTLPSLVLVGALAAEHGAWWATVTRVTIASAIGGYLFAGLGPAAREVAGHRLRLIEQAAPLLDGARRVAAADVGWVGAATSAHVVDLAGITDPTIATLPGGHTTKQISPDLLRRRDVDHVVLLLAPGVDPGESWGRLGFAKGVDARVAAEAAAEGYRLEAAVPLGGTRQSYLVVSRPDAE